MACTLTSCAVPQAPATPCLCLRTRTTRSAQGQPVGPLARKFIIHLGTLCVVRAQLIHNSCSKLARAQTRLLLSVHTPSYTCAIGVVSGSPSRTCSNGVWGGIELECKGLCPLAPDCQVCACVLLMQQARKLPYPDTCKLLLLYFIRRCTDPFRLGPEPQTVQRRRRRHVRGVLC